MVIWNLITLGKHGHMKIDNPGQACMVIWKLIAWPWPGVDKFKHLYLFSNPVDLFFVYHATVYL